MQKLCSDSVALMVKMRSGPRKAVSYKPAAPWVTAPAATRDMMVQGCTLMPSAAVQWDDGAPESSRLPGSLPL